MSVRQALLAELSSLDLDKADWCLVASRTATARELLEAFILEAAGEPVAAGLATELDEMLTMVSTGPSSESEWREARQLRDALIDGLVTVRWRD